MIRVNSFILATSIYFAWVIGFSIFSYIDEKQELLGKLDYRLELTTRNYLNVIPPGLHHKDMTADDISKEQDRALLLRMNAFAEANEVFYVYSMIRRDGKVYFTSGNGYEDDLAELNGGGYYFFPYPEAEPHIHRAFETDQPLFHDTRDRWGNFRSVFTRFQAEDGTTFVIGADLTTDFIDTLLRQKLFVTLAISILFLLFAFPMMLSFTASTRKWAKHLQQQTQLAEANAAKLGSIVDRAADAIITMDRDSIITSFNNAATSMFGYQYSEVEGQTIDIILPDLNNENIALNSEIDTLSDSDRPGSRTIELSASRKNGDSFPAELSISKVDLGNNECQLSTIIRDLSEKKVKEDHLLSLISRAEEASRAKTEFIHNVSHELRTPLHGILAFAQMGLKNADKLDSSKTEDYFHKILSSGERLKILLNDLLDLSKLEAGKMKLEYSEQNVATLVNECITEQLALLENHSLSIRIHDQLTEPCATFDAMRISQVFINILNNAIKYSPEGGEIVVRLSNVESILNAPAKGIEVCISDQGDGIEPELASTIFEKFVQASQNGTASNGTGLGLAICRELITLHRGQIWYQPARTGGAEFVFRIPALPGGTELSATTRTA